MLTDDIIKAPGKIIKEEDLVNVKHNIMHNTLVLESSHPFPGYHGKNLPEPPMPNNIYLVTETKYEGEDILRTAKKIKHSLPAKCDLSFGHACLNKKAYHFIRARGLDCFGSIPRLQAALAEEGIKFRRMKTLCGKALIKLRKYFPLKKIDENIFQDIDNPYLYYFEIPEKPPWEFFKKITIYIRSNLDKYSFDAALAIIYMEDITDMVRIYARDIDHEQLEFVRSKYLYELSHPDHLD